MGTLKFKEKKEEIINKKIIDLLSELSPYLDKMKQSDKTIFFEQKNMLNFRIQDKTITSLMSELEHALHEYSLNPGWYTNYVFIVVSELYDLVNRTIDGMAICDEFSIDSSEPIAKDVEEWIERCQILVNYSKDAFSKKEVGRFK